MLRDAELRAADVDRDRVAGLLRDHYVAGRLTVAEFEDRIERTYRALSYGELDAVLADLPTGRWPRAGVRLADLRDQRRLRRYRTRWHRFVRINLLLWALWGADLVTSPHHGTAGWWPVWVTVPWAAVLLTRTHPRSH